MKVTFIALMLMLIGITASAQDCSVYYSKQYSRGVVRLLVYEGRDIYSNVVRDTVYTNTHMRLNWQNNQLIIRNDHTEEVYQLTVVMNNEYQIVCVGYRNTEPFAVLFQALSDGSIKLTVSDAVTFRIYHITSYEECNN